MNTSQYMDKQIMDLSNSRSNGDLNDLANPQEHHIGVGRLEEIVPSYDFHPIRASAAPQPPSLDHSDAAGIRVWNSADFQNNASDTGTTQNYSSLDSIRPKQIISKKNDNVCDATLVAEIDQILKKHSDDLLYALEGISARLSQLESRTRHLENSVDDLKVSIGNDWGRTDGKMRELENILREVHSDVHIIKDKQEIVEAQLQLAKLQVTKVEQRPEPQSTTHVDSLQLATSTQQSNQQLPPSAVIQPPPSIPPPIAQLNPPPPVQVQNQFHPDQVPSLPQRESYFPPPGLTQDASNQQFQLPPSQLPPSSPPQQYQLPYHPQVSQPPPSLQQHPSLSVVNSAQTQLPLRHHPEEMQHLPSQNLPPSLYQIHPPPLSGARTSQQFYGTPPHMYEPSPNRPSSGFSPAHGPSSGPVEPYPYSGSPSHHGGGSTMRPPHLSLPDGTQSSRSGYPQLPTARILPHAVPTASGVRNESGSAGTGNRVPIDDVIDRVTNMGFPREQVRATVRTLTENGQSVDLNVVLDKLMNDGEGQPQRGWFGR